VRTLSRIRRAALALGLTGAGLGLVACGGEGSDAASGEERLVVGFSQIGAESDWRRANTESIRSEAEKRGIDLRFSDAQQRKENQIKAIRSFIAQRVDVIALSPVVETGFEQVLEEANRAGIPVVLADRAVEVSDPSLYVSFIGSDFEEEGRRAARWFVENTEGEVQIAELSGTPGSAPAIDRAKGFRDVIAEHERLSIVWSQSGNFTRTEGKQAFQAFLKSPDARTVTALYAHNDDMAIGAIQAIKEAGKDPGDDILIVSIDAVREAFRAMAEGDLNCTVECNPMIGPQLFDLIEAVARGEEVPRRVVVEEGVFTQEDAGLLESRPY
jgi:ABC-type sugar transport system substrate-binding protein